MQIVELPIEGISQITKRLYVSDKFYYSMIYDEENYQDLICSLKKEGEASIVDHNRLRYEYNLFPKLQGANIDIDNPNDNVMMIETSIIKPSNTEISYEYIQRTRPVCKIFAGERSLDIKLKENKQILIQIPSRISIINLNRSDLVIRVRSSSRLIF